MSRHLLRYNSTNTNSSDMDSTYLGGGAMTSMAANTGKGMSLSADPSLTLASYYGVGEEYDYSDVDAAVPGTSPSPPFERGEGHGEGEGEGDEDLFRVPTSSPQPRRGHKQQRGTPSRRKRPSAGTEAAPPSKASPKKLFRHIDGGSTVNTTSASSRHSSSSSNGSSSSGRGAGAVIIDDAEPTTPYTLEAREDEEDMSWREGGGEEEEEQAIEESSPEEDEETASWSGSEESCKGGRSRGAGKAADDSFENLFDPHEEAVLRALLVDKQRALSECTRKTSSLPAAEKKRLRNRHASCVSRIKKKLIMYVFRRCVCSYFHLYRALAVPFVVHFC